MKQNTESPMTRTAKASVLCGGLIVLAGCIAVFAPRLQMPALAFLFALNTGLHFSVWRRSVRRGKPMGATLSITLAEAWFLLVLVVFFASGSPPPICRLPLTPFTRSPTVHRSLPSPPACPVRLASLPWG